LLNKSCPPAFPPSQLRGIKPLPKNWEAGKAGGQDLFNKAWLRSYHRDFMVPFIRIISNK